MASPDRLKVAWLHLFAAGDPPGARAAWNYLWPAAKASLIHQGLSALWAMTTLEWMIDLLLESGFTECSRVVAFTQQPFPIRPDQPKQGTLETVTPKELPEIEPLDHAAFAPPWQIDSEALRVTHERSILATCFRMDGRIAGYLMAVPTPQGVHLTRLAVYPDEQNQGIGKALVLHLIEFLCRQGAPRITVNTQIENRRSQNLYRTLGFREMGESYPVFRIQLPSR